MDTGPLTPSALLAPPAPALLGAPLPPPGAARTARTALTVAAGLSALYLGAALVGLVLDDRVITGVPAWLKPAKFGLSMTAYLLTLRWLLPRVRGPRLLVATVAVTTATAGVSELALIGLQVVRGTTSHFNEATPFDAAVISAMGQLVDVLFLGMLTTAVLALRRGSLDAALAAGVRWGTGVCLLGMAEAVLMIINHTASPTGGHTVGAPDGGPGLPLIGWSAAHGDLRIAHFAGLHALQALPLLAWALSRGTALDVRTRARLVRVAGAGYAGLVVLLAWQALRDEAMLHPDGRTLLAAAALVVPTGAGAAAVLLRRPRR